jgi:hypothetical protein
MIKERRERPIEPIILIMIFCVHNIFICVLAMKQNFFLCTKTAAGDRAFVYWVALMA